MFSIGIHPTSVKEENSRLIGFIHCKLIELLTVQGFLMVQGLTANGVTVRWWPVFRKNPSVQFIDPPLMKRSFPAMIKLTSSTARQPS